MRRADMTWQQVHQINHQRVWKVIRRLDRQALMTLLARALRVVPARAAGVVFLDYARPHQVGDFEASDEGPLLEAVQEFCAAARNGDYYDDCVVMLRQFTSGSQGTQEFGARLQLMFDRCALEAEKADPDTMCQALECLFSLLREVERADSEIVFLTARGGVDELGVNWTLLLPLYFNCLSRSSLLTDPHRRVKAMMAQLRMHRESA